MVLQSLQRPPDLFLLFGLTHELQKVPLYLSKALQVPFGLLAHPLLLLPDQIDIAFLPIAGLLEHLLQFVLHLLVQTLPLVFPALVGTFIVAAFEGLLEGRGVRVGALGTA